MINVLSLRKNNRVFLYSQDKSSIAAAEVVNSIVLEFASQKEKTFQLIPGADVKSVLGEGDDLIQTHAESGMSYTPYHGKAGGGRSPYNSVYWKALPERGTFIRIRIYRDYIS